MQLRIGILDVKITLKQLYTFSAIAFTISCSVVTTTITTTWATAKADSRITNVESDISTLREEITDIAKNYSYVPERLARMETTVNSTSADVREIRSFLMRK